MLDSVISTCINEEKIPRLELSDKDYERLGVPVPTANAPVVGFLMGRSGDAYSADWNYVLALAKTGVRIVFLAYHHCSVQLQDCQGLVLPGGAFESSELFYTDPKNNQQFASLRQMAYSVCIRVALEQNKPILGICAGAQMVAGELGLKLYRSFDYVETPIQHKTNNPEAHRLNVFADTPLAEIFGEDNLFFVNSRHSELLAPWRVQRELWTQSHDLKPEHAALPLDIYAEANDGTPEAWGNADKHILCVQWHPEDMAAAGNEKMQGIYQWLVDEIRAKAN
ncbi:MAG: gamma-glutamyl-gamma-aminobutyrate hydrolase family protein [Alphaproteobacteria bacterium]|nr:gamma-glutamyl-gamma-aminobutyrate hydrolase family protein [Alphaproteobacteria bacterium]